MSRGTTGRCAASPGASRAGGRGLLGRLPRATRPGATGDSAGCRRRVEPTSSTNRLTAAPRTTGSADACRREGRSCAVSVVVVRAGRCTGAPPSSGAATAGNRLRGRTPLGGTPAPFRQGFRLRRPEAAAARTRKAVGSSPYPLPHTVTARRPGISSRDAGPGPCRWAAAHPAPAPRAGPAAPASRTAPDARTVSTCAPGTPPPGPVRRARRPVRRSLRGRTAVTERPNSPGRPR